MPALRPAAGALEALQRPRKRRRTRQQVVAPLLGLSLSGEGATQVAARMQVRSPDQLQKMARPAEKASQLVPSSPLPLPLGFLLLIKKSSSLSSAMIAPSHVASAIRLLGWSRLMLATSILDQWAHGG